MRGSSGGGGKTDKFFLEHLLYLLFSDKAKQLSIAMTTRSNLVVGGAAENCNEQKVQSVFLPPPPPPFHVHK